MPVYEFNKDFYSISMEIKDRIKLDKPQPLRGPARFIDKRKFCHYHNEIGHDTNDCLTLKWLLDKLAEKGFVEVLCDQVSGYPAD